jgi:Domain of unknown function (DUF4173)
MQQPVAPRNHPQPAPTPVPMPPPMPYRPVPPPLSVLNPVPIGPLPPTAFQRHWPLRSVAASPAALLIVFGVTLVGVLTIPLDRPGLGWLLTAAAAAGGLVLVGARDARTPKASIAWGAAVVALLGVGTIRASGWLFILCVLAAAGCAALSVAGAQTFTGLPLAFWSHLAAVFRALPWARRGLARVKLGNNGGTILRLAVSAGLGVLLLVIFGALFASADPAFDRIINAAIPKIDEGTVIRSIFLAAFVGGSLLGAVFLLANPSTLGDVEARPIRSVRRLEWAVPVGAVLIAFAAFVAVQVTVFFGDRDYVMRTVGLTFAQYARKGFWQLLVVTMLTLVVMAVAGRVAPRAGRGDRILLRVLLGALAAGALVVVASALWRMSVYEEAYGFTRLRVFVSAFEIWLGALFVLVLVAGVRLRAKWLAPAVVAAWVLTLIGLAALNPDRFIAEQNIARFHHGANLDVAYLSTLSSDAAPALDRLDGPMRTCALAGIASQLRDEPDDWRSYNVARTTAAPIVDHLDAPGTSCSVRY